MTVYTGTPDTDTAWPARGQVFAGLYTVGLLNGLFWKALMEGAASPLSTVLAQGGGVSWALWFCGFVAVHLTWSSSGTRLTRRDIVVIAAFVPFVLWPNGNAAWLGLTMLAAHAFHCARRDAADRAGAAVILVMMVALLWGKVVLHFFGRWLEMVDLWLLHLLTGVATQGNLLFFPGGEDNLVIAWGCTSFANLSIAIAVWMAVTRLFRPVARAGEWRDLAGAIATLVLMNSVRLFLASRSRDLYFTIHEPTTFAITNLLLLAATAAWALYGIRHELRG